MAKPKTTKPAKPAKVHVPKVRWTNVKLLDRQALKDQRNVTGLATVDGRTVVEVRLLVLVPGGSPLEAVENVVAVSLAERGFVQPISKGVSIYTVNENHKRGVGYTRLDLRAKDTHVEVLEPIQETPKAKAKAKPKGKSK